MRPVVKKMFCVDVWDSEEGLMATFEHPYEDGCMVSQLHEHAKMLRREILTLDKMLGGV